MRLTPKLLIVTAVVAALVVLAAIGIRQIPSGSETRFANANASGYAEASSCATCHEEIARTYARTGMGRSLMRLQGAPEGLADFSNRNRLQHTASNRHYTMIERDGRVYQRRHEIGLDGSETNVLEIEAHYVIGSGNHARTFVHREDDGRLRQLPVTWYAQNGGYWAMSPGYDRPSHLDFRRLIAEDCMSCHNAYPKAVRNEGNGPRFADPLPAGIDCQRCHGPGQAHINAARSGDRVTARRAIVNPADFDRDRQLDTCLQCHLETTSSPLPFQIRRYEQPAFSYAPGQRFGDYFIRFDHAPGTGFDDKFGVAGHAYRLKQSACFQQSRMTCGTCHDPHDVPRGRQAVEHYASACQSCHKDVHARGVPPPTPAIVKSTTPGSSPSCLDCHMPKRRTDDVAHVVMTDHYIQRRSAVESLLTPGQETTFEHSDYRGEVVLYDPPTLPPTAENELYLALAQVQQGSNLGAGIPRLERALATQKPTRPDFYYELARAFAKTSNYEGVIRWSEEALGRDRGFAPALKELAGAAIALGRMSQAAEALERAVAIHPTDADALADLGNVYLQQNQLDAAERTLAQALALDPMLSRANNSRGLAAVARKQPDAAERFFRAAIQHQPDLAEARNNLGNLLAGRKAYAEAAYHFERAIRADPAYAEARHSYGLTLVLMRDYARALSELREAVNLAKQPAAARVDLGDVLAVMGRRGEARREYERAAAETTDPSIRGAALDALRALP